MSTNIIFGPPGTGKTTKLISILKDKIAQGVHPSRIAFVSFTKEGALQGVTRARQAFPEYNADDFLHFRTIHSMCFQEVGARPQNMMMRKDYYKLGRTLGFDFSGYYSEEGMGIDDQYLFFDQLYRNNKSAAKEILHTLDVDKLRYIRSNYAGYKDQLAKVDYTDLLEQFVKMDGLLDVDYAIVDEAQDLTTLQWRVVWLAFRNVKELYIAGDDDQAIYQWSGADVKHFLGIEGSIEVLRESYRLPDNILAYSKRITKRIGFRAEKDYHGTGKVGKLDRVNDFREVFIDPNKSYLFLARNNSYLPEIGDWLRSQGLPHFIKGVTSIRQLNVNMIKLYTRIQKKPERYCPESEITMHLKADFDFKKPWYESFNWPPEELKYYRSVVQIKQLDAPINISVSTIHASKGSEADVVVVLSDISRHVQTNLDSNPDAEHRVFYVAMTRAKQELYVVCPTGQFSYPLGAL